MRQLFNGFQLKTVLKDNGHFVTRPNRNDGVVLLCAFDVVVAEGLGGFGGASANPHLHHVTRAE